LGNCFGYRLIFLLPCLPFIRAAANTSATLRWATATFTVLFITLMKPLSPASGCFFHSIRRSGRWRLCSLADWSHSDGR
jgi:hypothetical protein